MDLLAALLRKLDASGARPAIKTTLHGRGAHVQFALQVAKRRAHTLFDHRMVERVGEHLLDSVVTLHGPGQQMADVFGRRANHFSA